jgi:hypothetical protein
MDEAKFWTLLAEARAETADSTDPDDDFLDALYAKLEPLEPEEIAAFQRLVWQFNRQAYTYAMSGALYVMTDGEADEIDLEGFRGWLISQGEVVFKKTVSDPDSLADEDVVPADAFLPDMLTLAAELYKEQTAEELPVDEASQLPAEPAGDELSVEDLPQKMPRLCDQFIFTVDEEEAAAE